MQLLERASQLESLHSALREVATGQGCVALVYGEAGIGKTSLVEQFAGQNDKSWRILTGACDLLFTPRPLGPLGDIAFQTKGRLLRLLQGSADRESLFAACLSELQSQPTILIIEDIHWADEATLDLLKYLGRRIRQTTCLMILTYRDDEIGADSPLRLLLGDLAPSHAVHRVAVPALSVDAVWELVRGRNVDAVALHRLTNGNAFFLTEVLAGDGGQGVPETVRDALLARAARLSPLAREALEAASVAGQRVEVWLLSAISEGGPAGVEECVSRGLLRAEGNEFVFRHELARQAILESVPLTHRRELNRRALSVLKVHPETRSDLARLASHAAGTDDAGAVLEHAPAAARRAATASAHRQAVALYDLALRFADALPAREHARMLEADAEELRFLGRPDRSIPMHQEVIARYHALGDRVREGAHLALVALELNEAGRLSESAQAISAAISMLEALPPDRELARAYRTQCHLLATHLDFLGSVEAGERAIAMAEQFGDLETVARGCNNTGCALLSMEAERGREMLQRSLTIGLEHGLAYAVGGTLANWAATLVDAFRFQEAEPLLEEGIAYTTAHDDDYHLGGLFTARASIELYQGRWAEADLHIRQALHRSGEREITSRLDNMVLLGRLGVRRGDADAERTLNEALGSVLEANYRGRLSTAAAIAEAAWLGGDQQIVLERTEAAHHLAMSQHVVWAAAELAFWRWRAGDSFTPPDWIARPYALQMAGDWRGAAREWGERGCPYEQGMALMDGDEAAQLAALEIFEGLGARPIFEKLKRKMREEGIRGIPRGPRPSTRENPFGLTGREMEVLGCLVKGSSNNSIARRLSISARTVEHHIASISQKTGAQTRSELVALALRDMVAPRQ